MTDPTHASDNSPEATFTDAEYEEFFGTPEPLLPKSRRIPLWARFVGLFVAGAMFVTGILSLVDNVRTNPDIREPIAIEDAAWNRVSESDYGWLVEDILVVPINELRVGAFVTNNPPDGVITIDMRPWTKDQLDELLDHEIGHLLDFAIWDPLDPARKGGLRTEVWAECAAVDAGTRRLDPRDPGGEYHCLDDEYDIYTSTLATITDVCKKWGDRACRNVLG